MQITRYLFQTLAREIIGEGLRSAGGQRPANEIWVKMMGAPNKEGADYGRRKTGRTMPV